jgi:DNA-binding transcriptional ArsR family regulator
MKNSQHNTFLIEDLATLQVIAEPLRSQIFELLVDQPLTVRQVADRLGLAPGRLYYHINLLEKHNLIRVVETRQVANMLEKLYQAVAGCLDVADSLLDFSKPENTQGLLGMMTAFIDTAREDLLRSFQARQSQLEQGAAEQPRHMMANRDVNRLTRAQADQFTERLQVLMTDFAAMEASPTEEDAVPYALTIVFNPSFYFNENASPEGKES